MKQANGQKPVSRVRASVVLSIASVVFTGLTALGIWLMWRYMDDPAKVREIIGDHYVLGALCMILISAVQVVVALIPGELVEISAGYVFGAWGGALLCLAGTTLGSVLVLLGSILLQGHAPHFPRSGPGISRPAQPREQKTLASRLPAFPIDDHFVL